LQIFVSNSIAKRIKRASEQIVVLASGELGQELAKPVKNVKDEVDVMNNAIFDLHRELKDIITVISDEAKQLNSSNTEFQDRFTNITENVRNVNSAMEEIATGSTTQASETTSAGEQVADMADVIEQNSEKCRYIRRDCKAYERII